MGMACSAQSVLPDSTPNTDALHVLTALPFTLAVASELADGTSLVIDHIPTNGRRPSSLPSYLERTGDRFAEYFVSADASVSIGKLWPDDPLYTLAREYSIQIIDIDATKPWSLRLEGIAVAAQPTQDAPWAAIDSPASNRVLAPPPPSIYFWHSLANAARSVEIVGNDLIRLAPQSERSKIADNLTRFRDELLDTRRIFEARLTDIPDPTIAALTADFVYLTNDFGIFVDSYFLKQDVDWTDSDLSAFSGYLEENDIKVVLHKWEPDARIRQAISDGGATLAILDPIDLGIVGDAGVEPDSYQQLFRRNLETLWSTLEAAN